MYSAEVRVDLKATPDEMIAGLKVLKNKYETIDSGDQDEVIKESQEIFSGIISELEQTDSGTEQTMTFYFDYPLTQDVVDAGDLDLESAIIPFARSMKKGELSILMEWEGLDDFHSIEIEAVNGTIKIENYDHVDEYEDH